MKKTLFFSMIFFLLFSCNKEDSNVSQITPKMKIGTKLDMNEDNLTYQGKLEEYSVPKEKIRSVIESFLQREISQRAEPTYNLSESIWHLETGVNYLKGNAGFSYKTMHRTEHYYYLARDEESMIYEEDLLNLIETIKQQVDVDRLSLDVPGATKETVYVNITPFSNDNGEIIVKALVGTGLGGDVITVEHVASLENCTFLGQEGLWRWSQYMESDCGEYTRASTNSLKALLNYNDEDWICPLRFNDEFYDGFFTQIQSSPGFRYEDFPNPDDDIPNDGYRDYLLFATTEGTPAGLITCLDDEEMNFYYHGARQIINIFLEDYFSGKEFVEVTEFWGDFLVCSGPVTYEHFFRFNAGVYVP